MLPRRPIPFLLLCAPLAAQTTYYVDAAGVPPGSGTQADPWTSIQTALDLPPAAGDTILVAPGNYVENLRPPTNGFILESTAGPLSTTITGASTGSVVLFEGLVPGFATLDGFTITGGTPHGVKTNAFVHCTVTNCILANNAGSGLFQRFEGVLTQSTVVNNNFGFKFVTGTEAEIFDTVFASNASGDFDYLDFGTECFIKNSIYEDGLLDPCCVTEINVIHEDPSLWETATADVHLRPGSPAIGAGTLGQDIGALPYDPGYAPSTPQSYCLSKPNSLGCLPSVGFTGTPSVSGGAFDVTCDQTLNNKLGLLFYGYQCKQVPYQGGWLCVSAPVKRTPVMDSGGNVGPNDCSGVYSFDFAAHMASGIDPSLVPGQSVFAQFWYRDPNDPTGFATGRSDALAFTVLP